MNPEISVVMSVYNDEKFLKESIESILTQTYENFEFIICNDCSTDNSEKTIIEYAKKDSRIIYIKNDKNRGLSYSLNKCIKIAKGKYICRMDSDDISLHDRLEKQYYFLERHQIYDVLSGQAELIDSFGKTYSTTKSEEKELSIFDGVKKSCLIHPTVMMKRVTLNKIGNYTVSNITRRGQDYDLWMKFLYNDYRIFISSDMYIKYREDPQMMKKRKYKYRICEFKMKYQWMKKINVPVSYYFYAFKPLIVGLVPNKAIYIYHKWRNS